jgi:hypothetical protein
MSFLCKYGYAIPKCDVSLQQLTKMKNTLLGRPKSGFSDAKPQEPFRIYTESRDYIYVPKCYGITHFGKTRHLQNYIGKTWEKTLEFEGNLYDYQIDAQNILLDELLNGSGGGIMSLKTGQGKTITAISTMVKLKTKTLVVVNKIPLMKQWEAEIKKFVPGISISNIQGKIVDTSGDVCIAMIQTISRPEHSKKIFEKFGCVIFDECHNVCSKVFSNVLGKTCSRYTIGLTATPTRSDACEYIFEWGIGDVVYKSTKEISGKHPIVRLLKLHSKDYKQVTKTNKHSNKEQIQYSTMISELVKMKNRNGIIVSNRKILVLSERRSHLETLKSMLVISKVKFSIGIFVGAMKTKDLDEARACDVILATYAAFSEGVSEKDLDTLVLTTPKKYIGHLQNSERNESGKLEQICGRIFRKEHVVRHPVIVDFQDVFSVYIPQSKSRCIFYKKCFKNLELHEENINMDGKCVLEEINDPIDGNSDGGVYNTCIL